MEIENGRETNLFSLLSEEIITLILDHLEDDPFSRKSFSQVCKYFYSIESTHRSSLKPRRLELVQGTLQRFPSISHLDFSLCPRVEDHTLASISLAWKSSLRSINLSGSRFFTHQGLSTLVFNCSNLVQIDLSNRTDLTDSAAKAIAGAQNLERLFLARCKSITDMGIGCIAVKCTKLRSICLRWCLRVTDFGVGLIAIKCKQIQSLDLSYLPITEKCLSLILQLKHLEELTLEHCLGLDDDGLTTLKESCKSLKVTFSFCDRFWDPFTAHCAFRYTPSYKGGDNFLQSLYSQSMVKVGLVSKDFTSRQLTPFLISLFLQLSMLNLSNCQNISHIGLAALTNGAQNVEKLVLSYSLSVSTSLVKYLQNFSRLQSVILDGCQGTCCAVKTIGNWHASLKELSLRKCESVIDESLSFLVQTHKQLKKLDITCCSKITSSSIDSITSSCPMLTSLRMESCSLVRSDAFLLIRRLQFLEELDVTETEIDNEGVKSISVCSKLSCLKLGLCLKITDKGLCHIGSSCSKLTELDLYRCTGITDAGIAAIAHGCPSLEGINIAYNTKITDNSLVSLSKCLNLRRLEIRGCPQISWVGFSAVSVRCKQLTVLDIKKCHNVNDTVMIQLAKNSQNLERMKLSHCSVTDVGLIALATMSSLQQIAIFHMEGLTSNGMVTFLLACRSLTRVKLHTTFKSLLPKYVLQYMEARGCLLDWRDKPFQTSSWE